jgi:hypothetical protein
MLFETKQKKKLQERESYNTQISLGSTMMKVNNSTNRSKGLG